MGAALEKRMAYDTAKALAKASKETKEEEDRFSVEQRRNKVVISRAKAESRPSEDIIDLKQSFKKSSKVKYAQDGGWYMVIPMRRYTSRKPAEEQKSTDMSHRLYKDLLASVPKRGYANLASDYLYDNRRGESQIQELNYRPKSKKITRLPHERFENQHTYVSFRTVSNKSHPASWIINREKIKEGNRSKEIDRIIREVKRYYGN